MFCSPHIANQFSANALPPLPRVLVWVVVLEHDAHRVQGDPFGCRPQPEVHEMRARANEVRLARLCLGDRQRHQRRGAAHQLSEAAGGPRRREQVDLAALVAHAVAQRQPDAPSATVAMPPGAQTVTGDPDQLALAVTAIVQFADEVAAQLNG